MSRRLRLGLGALTALSLTLPATLAHAASSGAPDAAACGQIELAPIIDQADDGSKIKEQPDRRGVYVPIIMVPDWTGRATHDQTRTGDFSIPIDMGATGTPPASRRASLIGQLQQIPGAAVYTFDYRASAGKWVDDPGIGPALGDAIDCVTAALGQKAILITHGLGGVAARYAVAGQVAGHDRGDKVSTVIGFGSPQSGSQLADLTNTAVGSTASEPRILSRLLLGACAGLASAKFDPYSPCGSIPPEATAIGNSGAAGNYRAGSAALTGLLPYPPSVTLDSFAGDVQVKAANLGWFNLRPFRTDNVSLGDLAASTASVTVQSRSQLRSTCSFTLNAFGSGAQSVGLRLDDPTAPQLGPVWASTVRQCYGADLTRVSEFADSVTQIITKEIRNRQPLDTSELESLPVPALCGHPAGNLVGGYLPNIPADQGEVALASTLDPSRFKDYTVFGDITDDGVPDTVVVLKCTDASGTAQDAVAAYDSQATLLGSVSLDTITGRPRNEVYRVSVAKELGRIDWRTTRDTDSPCCPTVDASASFVYDKSTGGLKADKLVSYNETEIARALFAAARAGKADKKALAMAPTEIINAMIAANRDTGVFRSLTCYGPSPEDGTWPNVARADFGDSWPPQDNTRHGDRFCLIKLGATGAGPTPRPQDQPGATPPAEPERYALLGLEHVGFRQWMAVEFRLPGQVDNGDDGGGDDGGGGGGIFGTPRPGGPLF
ncbi:MAG TPA: hypothetical protein VGL04_06325 [Sporichthyaceae bacterium]